MRLSLESNIRKVERDLSDAARKQVPFATSLALNETAKHIQKAETARLSKVLDRPTPFTRRAYAIRRATKRRLEARVFVKPIQAAYLSRLEDGGTRTPAGRAIVTPARIRLNKYGNMPRRAIQRNLARPDTFSGKPKGRSSPGIYQRKRGKLVKLASYTRAARYRPQLRFKLMAERRARRAFPAKFQRALAQAFATRRR